MDVELNVFHAYNTSLIEMSDDFKIKLIKGYAEDKSWARILQQLQSIEKQGDNKAVTSFRLKEAFESTPHSEDDDTFTLSDGMSQALVLCDGEGSQAAIKEILRPESKSVIYWWPTEEFPKLELPWSGQKRIKLWGWWPWNCWITQAAAITVFIAPCYLKVPQSLRKRCRKGHTKNDEIQDSQSLSRLKDESICGSLNLCPWVRFHFFYRCEGMMASCILKHSIY